MKKKTIDLNCDMGELKEGQDRNYDAIIMPYISHCNIACGFHSGTPFLIEQTIKAAIKNHVKIGAHPSYNDRIHFGRRSLQVDQQILMAELRYQISALKGMVESFGARLHHVKAHGALYNDMLKDDQLAAAFVLLVKTIDPNLRILALAHSNVIDLCKKHDMQAIREGFADRSYQKRTQLRSRQLDNAVLHKQEAVLAQVQSFLEGKILLYDGEIASIQVDSICLHSDTKGAVNLSKSIYEYLNQSN
ncbi:MAG: 5-oxoprolinase subunit PxpA [Bacteroidota bacterium]